MDTKEEFDDEHLFKKIEQHNRNVNVAVSLTIVATTLIGVMAMRAYIMNANAQEVKSEFELKYEEDVRRFKQEIAEANETSQQRYSKWVRDTSYSDSSYSRSSKESHFNKLDYKKALLNIIQKANNGDIEIGIDTTSGTKFRIAYDDIIACLASVEGMQQ